jgi:hypothetical protein
MGEGGGFEYVPALTRIACYLAEIQTRYFSNIVGNA